MGTLNPEDQVLAWVAETKEAVLLVCQSHYPGGELPAYPWFLSKAKNSKVQSSLAELMYRAHMNCRQFSHHVGEYLGSLSTEIDSCRLALGTTASDIVTVGTEMKKLKQDPAEPSDVAMTLNTNEYTFALLSKGEVYGQPARLPVTVELDLTSLTVIIHEDNVHEQLSPKEVLSKLNIEKLRLPAVNIDRHILLKSGRSCGFTLTFHLSDADRAQVYTEQIRVLEEVAKRTSDKKAELEAERKEIMKVLGIDEELKANRPEQSRGCDKCGGVALGYLTYNYVRESGYHSHFLNLRNKSEYLKAMHTMTAPKLNDMLKGEVEVIKSLRSRLIGDLHGKVLEVAIGSAPNLPHYADDVDLTGIDWSPKMLELARARTPGKLRSLKLTEGDVSHLPYEADTFDAVVCTFGLCSALQPLQVLAEMRRVVRPLGVIVLIEHGAADTWLESFRLELTHYRDLCTTGCNNNQDVDRLVISSGLHIVQRHREDKGRIYAYTLKPNKG